MNRVAEVAAANRAFYEAFETRDLDAMSDVWEHSDQVVCTHPGWASLRGWGAVIGSFAALFQGRQRLQFVLTEERIQVGSDMAYVAVDENLLGGGGATGSTVAAVNVFKCDEDGRWLLVLHHGSVVAPAAGEDEA